MELVELVELVGSRVRLVGLMGSRVRLVELVELEGW